jgi:hypothetical protein
MKKIHVMQVVMVKKMAARERISCVIALNPA